jgi:uncharacterized protein YbjQ (UPF0145 family)
VTRALTPPDGTGWTAEQIATASTAEVAAGRLPLQAQWRIAEQRTRRDAGEPGSFTSDLTVEEFAAIRSVGFSPVGQVMGSAVYNVGWSYTGCGYFYGVYPGVGVLGGGFGGGFAPAPVVPVPATQQLLNQARHRAVARMRAECAGLGGDGVVGVRLSVSSFYGNGLEFFAIGTAVRADGTARPRTPFTSDLSGQDFAKLLRAGWVPVALVQGVGAMVQHDDWRQRAQQSSWYNQEIAGSTELLHAARDAARDSLAEDARRSGGHTVILRDMSLSLAAMRCMSGQEGEDHVADAFLWGTAIVPLDPTGRRRATGSEPPLQMLKLNPGAGPQTERGNR